MNDNLTAGICKESARIQNIEVACIGVAVQWSSVICRRSGRIVEQREMDGWLDWHT